MRAIFGVISLLVVLVVIGLLAKKQLSAVHLQSPVLNDQLVTLPGASPQLQSQQIEHQIKQSVEAAMQQARPMPDDAK